MSTTIKSINEPKTKSEAPEDTGPASINEPPGSTITAAAPTAPPPQQREPLPPNDELHAMKRSELDDLAHARGVDISGASNKEEVIELLHKDARKRR